MVEIIKWLSRKITYLPGPKLRNVLVTYNGTEVRWCTEKEAQKMVDDGVANFITPQDGETIKYTELVKENSEPTLDE